MLDGNICMVVVKLPLTLVLTNDCASRFHYHQTKFFMVKKKASA